MGKREYKPCRNKGYMKILIIPWTDRSRTNDYSVLKELGIETSQQLLVFFGYIIRANGLENGIIKTGGRRKKANR